jgi:hypothetical protein
MANGIVEITRAGKVLRVDEHKAGLLVARGEAVLGRHPAPLVESDEKRSETNAQPAETGKRRRRMPDANAVIGGDEWPN